MAPVIVNSFVLSRYQRSILCIFENLFTVNIEKSKNTKFYRNLLCDGDTQIKHKNDMSLQTTTLLLSIYTNILENMKETVSDTVLHVCDELVFSGLFNLQYDNINLETTINDILEEFAKMVHTTVNLNFNDIIIGIYGLNRNNEIVSDPYTVINAIELQDNCKTIFTRARYLNMLNFKSDAMFFTNAQHFQIIINHIRDSKFMVEETHNINMYTNTNNLAYTSDPENLETVICINNRNIPICYNLNFNAVEFYDDNLLYTVIIKNDLHKSYFHNIILTESYIEAATEALEYEYGMVVAFPRALIVMTKDYAINTREEFLNRSYNHNKLIVHISYIDEHGNINYCIVDPNFERYYLNTNNIRYVFDTDGSEVTKYNKR